ncbi:elongation of very long chain fatty acids protein AAEL008004-like [Oppia nitens]|uniref:elongation of very long chain fatty acids protein AAEL008004-like n=1 Tax=Oppia nitens TaxID=1686743 RepID=UPI0023DB6EC7|nr:elongation of very long chain fatty acids protein AAEL008004-like [Oppia nitens]
MPLLVSAKTLLLIDDFMSAVNYCIYDYLFDMQDPRTKHLPLIDYGLGIPILFLTSYFMLVKVFIPQYMEKRKPFNLRWILLIYNAGMSFGNLFAFITCLEYMDYGRVIFDVDYPTDKSSNEESRVMIILGFCYLISKLLDWFDSIFFCLRKKDSHLTLLHMYHHMVVPLFGWLIIKIAPFIPGLRLFSLMNSFIHFLMYGYYFLSAFGPRVKRYLWWKRYITQMQLAQFIILGIYGFIFLFFQRGYPVFWLYVAFPQPIFFFYMFYDFYVRTYVYNQSYTNNNDINVNNVKKID